MNDRDMEQLISRLDRPAPGPTLDARIAETTRKVQPEHTRAPLGAVLRLGSSIACALLVGFVLGRQSVSLPPSQSYVPALAAPGTTDSEPELVASRALVPANEAFVQLVTKPKTLVSVFGSQPLEAQSHPSHVQ
ncbi:MAG TPA: hypothetical protein VFG04_02455 [Planctomycetaceae bacterium]|nr:hypothetical protein [Planctomycetaceae bacterium]